MKTKKSERRFLMIENKIQKDKMLKARTYIIRTVVRQHTQTHRNVVDGLNVKRG